MTYSRTRLTADTTFYASPSGAGSQDGSSTSNPFAGVQAAWNALQRDYDLNGFTATIQLMNGGYTAGLEGYGPMLGQMKKGGSPVIIKGDPTASGVYFNTPGVNTFSFDGGAAVTIVLMTISASNASPLYATNGAIIEYGSIIFGTASAHVLAATGGTTICTGSCTLAQGAVFHVQADHGYAGIVPGVTLTLASGVGFSYCFAFAGNHGLISCPIPGVNFAGSATGMRGYASLLGILNCSGNANSLPGNSACGANYGGQVY